MTWLGAIMFAPSGKHKIARSTWKTRFGVRKIQIELEVLHRDWSQIKREIQVSKPKNKILDFFSYGGAGF